MKKTFHVTFTYTNTISDNLGIWMVIPADAGIRDVHPEQVCRLETGEELGYVVLEEGDRMEVGWTQEEYEPRQQLLTEEARTFYLRDTTLSPKEKVREKALELTDHVADPKEKARAIFFHIVEDYRYVYPPQSRGVVSFLETQKGDCGEFSFLFAAMCRSVGIPARTVVGSWAYGKMNAHVWNECYVDGEGWIPVDTSMANVQKRQPLRFFSSDVPTLYWKKYFGQTEGRRIVFSLDAELPLVPSYEEVEDPLYVNAMPINGQSFCWGQQSLDGAAPYLQPIYIKMDHVPERDLSLTELLGSWKVKGPALLEGTSYIKKATFFIGIISVVLSFFMDRVVFDALFTGAFAFYSLSCLLRKERVRVFGILFILMILSFSAAVDKIVS